MPIDLVRISEYIGLVGFILWAIMERGFSLSGQQQSEGRKQHQGSYWLLSLCWYGAMLFSIFDAFSLKITVFAAPMWILRGLGIILTISGLVIRFLARKTLGKQYSVHVETSDTHDLVITGIYSVVRHPAYLGLMCLFLGIPLCLGSWGGIILAVAGGIPAIINRIVLEEKLLNEWFGKQYEDYKENTWRLIPYLW